MGDQYGRLGVDFGADDWTPPPDDPGPVDWTPPDEPDDYARRLDARVRSLRIDREARARLASEGNPAEPFDAGTLAEVLARPDDPGARVAGLMPWEGSTLIVAQRKTGKTTLTLNLARCLLTGEPFLGSLAVRRVASGARVALLNYEVSGAQLARWARDVGVPADRLFLVNLRGRRNPLSHPEDRAALAALLRAHNVEALIVDPFGRAYTGTSQNDSGEVGAWLVDLDRFARTEVGALDVILTAHAGWNGERTRGSSALEDWADSVVTLTRDDEGARFLRAMGRDVDLDEDRLDFDPATRLLSLSGQGSRKDAGTARKDAETRELILDLLSQHPEGLSGEQLRKEAQRQDADFTRARDALVADESSPVVASKRAGRGGGSLYRLTNTEPREPRETPVSRDLTNPANPYVVDRGSGSRGLEPNPARVPSPETLDALGRCRLHHDTPAPGCWTCDQLGDPERVTPWR